MNEIGLQRRNFIHPPGIIFVPLGEVISKTYAEQKWYFDATIPRIPLSLNLLPTRAFRSCGVFDGPKSRLRTYTLMMNGSRSHSIKWLGLAVRAFNIVNPFILDKEETGLNLPPPRTGVNDGHAPRFVPQTRRHILWALIIVEVRIITWQDTLFTVSVSEAST